MTSKPRKTFEKLISSLALMLALPSSGWTQQSIYKEFLSGSDIVTVSGEQVDEQHVRIDTIQIAQDKYHELRVLNPKTGETDILEYSDPKLQVTYTIPFRGKFLNLQIKRREKTGFQIADFVLSPDQIHYVLVRKTFKKYRIMYQDLNPSSNVPCKTLQQSLVNDSGIDPVFDVLNNDPQNNDPQIVAKRIAAQSCQTEKFEAEYPSILKGLSQVVASRDSKTGTNGKFLACLNNHQLKYYSGKLEQYFSDSLRSESKPTVVCEYIESASRGDYDPSGDESGNTLTSFNKPFSYVSNLVPELDAASFYADTFFHESLHRVGIDDEELTKNLVSCCGQESQNGNAEACTKVDQEVANLNKRNSRLKASLETLDGFQAFWLNLQSKTDSERASVFYDEFLNHFGAKAENERDNLVKCLQSQGANPDKCTQSFVTNVNSIIDLYFAEDCQSKFKDMRKNDRSAFCSKLNDDAKNLFQNNLNKVCDPSKATIIEKSCLMAVYAKEQTILNKATKSGQIVDDPDQLQSPAQNFEQKRLTESFLASFSHQISGLDNIYIQIVDKINIDNHTDRADAVLYALIKFLGQTTSKMRDSYNACVNTSKDKSSCATDTQHVLFNGKNSLAHFFKRICPTYFTDADITSTKACNELSQEISKAFKDSFSTGCKTQDDSKRIGAPGNDLTCFFNAVDEGKYNYANYEQLKKEGKLNTSVYKMQSTLTPEGESKAVADQISEGGGSKPKPISIGDQSSNTAGKPSGKNSGKPSTAQNSNYADSPISTGGHSHDRSPASSGGAVYPSADLESQLKKELAAQSTPVAKVFGSTVGTVARKVLQGANRVISSVDIPQAQAAGTNQESVARSNMDTSPLAVPVPGHSNRGSLDGIIKAAATTNKSATDSTATASSATGRKSASTKSDASETKDRGQSATAKAEDGSKATTDAKKRKGGATASTADSSKASASQKGQSSTGAPANMAHGDAASKSSAASENLHHLQNSLLKHFKEEPKWALARLKKHTLDGELNQYLIQAKDENGQSYGSDSPRIKIWYDKDVGVFKGLPDDL